jgi:hypothetical protein
MKIQLTTLARYKPKISDGAKLNLGISGKKQEVILMCCMSTSNSNQVLEISHFANKPNLRMLHIRRYKYTTKQNLEPIEGALEGLQESLVAYAEAAKRVNLDGA